MLWLILRLALDVRMATLVGAAVAGEPELGPRLVAIARRESGLRLVGVHQIDAWASERVRPRSCPRRPGWSTRGAHGLMAGHTVRHLPRWAACSPWLLDVPAVSAYAAARRARSRACRRAPRCRSWLRVSRRPQ